MAWNRPIEDGRAVSTKPPLRRGYRPRPTVRSAIAGGIVVLGAAIAAWWLWSDMSATVAEGGDGTVGRRIRSATSSIGRGRVLVATNRAVKTESVDRPEVEHAEVFLEPKIKGRLVVWKRRDPPPVFTNQFENYVASILTTAPGERFLNDTVSEDFDKAFNESLHRQIEIGECDSEDVIELKKAVIETREEIRRQVAGGQKASEIVVAALKEMNKIADYRDEVQQAFNAYLLTETDPKEIMKYKKEADAMLGEYGALPINGPLNEGEAYERMVEAKEEKVDELTEKLGKEE